MFWVLCFRAWNLYRFSIDVKMLFGFIFDVFWCFLQFARATFWTMKKIRFHNVFQCYYHSEKNHFRWFPWSFPWPVLALILDHFWHRFSIHFVIPLASNSMFVGDRFWDDFLKRFVIDFASNWFRKGADGTLLVRSFFASFFRTLVPFRNVRPTSASNNDFQLFQKKKQMYPHLYLSTIRLRPRA